MQKQAIFRVASLKVTIYNYIKNSLINNFMIEFLQSLKEGDVVFYKGDECKTLFILVEGSCGMYID